MKASRALREAWAWAKTSGTAMSWSAGWVVGVAEEGVDAADAGGAETSGRAGCVVGVADDSEGGKAAKVGGAKTSGTAAPWCAGCVVGVANEVVGVEDAGGADTLGTVTS